MADLFGKALLDFQNGDYTHDLITETQASKKETLPLPYLFRSFTEMPSIEQVALQHCNGKTLDVGCGAGCHALYLQNKGFDVTAIDLSEGAVTVCKKRGVKKAFRVQLLDYNNPKFDTIILLMNGSGIFKSIHLLPTYLNHLKKLLQPKGQVLMDSSDIQYLYPQNKDGSIWVPADRYYGELQFTLYYKDYIPEKFNWLYLDPNMLRKYCKKVGFTCEIITKGDHYDYLARLTLT